MISVCRQSQCCATEVIERGMWAADLAHPKIFGVAPPAIRHCRLLMCSEGPEIVKQKVSEAKKMLELWKSSYLNTRAKIESSGRDARWEFDRKKLFEKTDHMAAVCNDLYHVAQVPPQRRVLLLIGSVFIHPAELNSPNNRSDPYYQGTHDPTQPISNRTSHASTNN